MMSELNTILQARAVQHFAKSVSVLQQLEQACMSAILQTVEIFVTTFRSGNKLMLCGNGGSAADAQHIATEFVCRLSKDFERPGLPAIALTTDSSFLTAYVNDYANFAGVFERQVLTLGKAGDVLIGISTSGNSANVINAVCAAHTIGIKTVGWLGEGGVLTKLVDCAIVVPSNNTQHVQESLLAVEHILCELTERVLFDRL